MTCRILAVGKCKGVVESLLWAASAGVTRASEINLLWADGTQEDLQSLVPQLSAYHCVREILPEDASWQGFRAKLEVTLWQTETADTAENDQGEDALLWQALTAACDDASLERKRRTVSFAKTLQTLSQDSPLRQWIHEIEQEEEAQVLLCGHSDEEEAAAKLPLLAKYLRENLSEKHRIGALLFLPQERKGTQAAEALLSREDWLCADILNAVYWLGLPEDAWREQQKSCSLLDWLATRCMQHFFFQKADGCYAYHGADAWISWQVFEEDAELYRKRYGTLWRLAVWAEGIMDPTVNAALAGKNVLQARGLGCDAACYRAVRKLLASRADANAWQAVMTCLRGFNQWLGQMMDAVPVTMRYKNTQSKMQLEAGENYRSLLEAYGQWVMMQEDIKTSGMDTESVVRRGVIQENEADEALRLAREQHDEVLRLEGNQRVLDRRTGGMAKMRLMDQMASGIARAMEQEQAQAERGRKALENTEDLKLRHSIRRLENHLRLLHTEWDRVLKDQDEAEENQVDRLPPVIPEGTREENALIAPDCWTLASDLQKITEVREHKAKWAEASGKLSTAVEGAACHDAQEILRVLMDKLNVSARQETSSVGILLAGLLEAAGEVEP